MAAAELTRPSEGSGIAGLIDRAEALAGTVTVESSPPGAWNVHRSRAARQLTLTVNTIVSG